MDYSFLAVRLSFTFMYTCIFFSWQINSAAAACDTSNNMKLVHWALMGDGWATQAPPHCTKCNSVPSTPSVQITVLLYNGPLLCGFNVPL